ncbi:MAG: ribose 5-phosphate isomerase B [candidate division WOR-3 bacterium]
MRIGIASDHRGFALKQELLGYLKKLGYQVEDFGTDSAEPVDYPDYAWPVANAVAKNAIKQAILICGTGIGMSIVANRVPGVRAALCTNLKMAVMARQHNDANILCLGANTTGRLRARQIVRAWLETSFARGRHLRRLNKLRGIERRLSRPG